MAKDTLKERVRKILADNISTRNDDIELTIKYWEVYHDITGPTINIRTMFTLPTHKDLARYRAVIQNEEHQYIPTIWQVAKARDWNEQRWRKLLGYSVYEPPKAIKPEDVTISQPVMFDIEPIKEQNTVYEKDSFRKHR